MQIWAKSQSVEESDDEILDGDMEMEDGPPGEAGDEMEPGDADETRPFPASAFFGRAYRGR